MSAVATASNPVWKKFEGALKAMNKSLIERNDEIRMCLTGLIAQEHVLFVGPPGTAKSLLLDSLAVFCNGSKFITLLNKFTAPEELYGPISLKGLKEDKYRRVIAGKLPEAQFAYLDEIFKASSAILNTTLRLLNERVFDIGDGELVPCPLRLCVASSNEWPGNDDTGKELTALYDRFLLRKTVKPIAGPAGRRKLLWNEDLTPKFDELLEHGELDVAYNLARALPWNDTAKEQLEELLSKLAAEGIIVGDRRQRKAVNVTRAYAWLNGRDEVTQDDLEICQHILWDDPIEQAPKVRSIINKICNPTGAMLRSLVSEAEEIVSKVDHKEISEAATACTKLNEIKKKISAMKADPSVTEAKEKLSKMITQLRDLAISADDE